MLLKIFRGFKLIDMVAIIIIAIIILSILVPRIKANVDNGNNEEIGAGTFLLTNK